MKINNTAIIVAAGHSTRMKNAGNKLFLSVGGVPILAHTLLRYEKAKSINSIIVVTRPELFENVKKIVTEYHITKFQSCTEGGKSRQQSVYNGILAAANADIVSIADGARPFTRPDDIDRVSAAAEKDGGAIMCVSVKDTIKQTKNGKIVLTPPREQLLQAQTPQTFDRKILLPLMERALKEKVEVTDDASILEQYGFTVTPVIGSYDNIKITTDDDMILARQIAAKEEA